MKYLILTWVGWCWRVPDPEFEDIAPGPYNTRRIAEEVLSDYASAQAAFEYTDEDRLKAHKRALNHHRIVEIEWPEEGPKES